MADRAAKRIQLELRDIIESEKIAPCGIKVELINDSLLDLKCEIVGPPDTPYEGGKFELEVNIFKNYPYKPPEVWFITKIWHANICSRTGYICLDILKDDWTASLTIRTILLSLQLLLSSPEPDDPQDLAVAAQFKTHPELFKLTARHWTNVYAGGPSKIQSFDDKIKKMIELGFSETKSRDALSSNNWNIENAIDEIDNYRSDYSSIIEDD